MSFFSKNSGWKRKPPIGVPINHGHHLARGLVGYWAMQDGKGGELKDLSGFSNHGILTNSPTWTKDHGGGSNRGGGHALSFDGSNDYVDLGTDPSLSIQGSYTVSSWVKTSLTTGTTIIDKNGATATNYRIIIDTRSSGTQGVDNKATLLMFFPTGGKKEVNSSTSVNDGVWHHIAGVYDISSNLLHIYVDGSSDATPVAGGSGDFSTDSDATLIGTISNAGSPVDSYMDGIIDDVRLYNRALSAEEIYEIYKSPWGIFQKQTRFILLPSDFSANPSWHKPWNKKPPMGVQINHGHHQARNLLGMWTMREGSGTKVHDVSGQGNDGTLTNMTQSDWSASKSDTPRGDGLGLDLDGTNDYITASSDVDNNAEISISTWFKTTSGLNGKYIVSLPLNGASSSGFDLRVSSTPGIQSTLSTDSGNTTITATVSDITNGEWRHLTATYDGVTHRIYVDGIEGDSAANSGAIRANETTKTIEIGRFGSLGENVIGSVDDVRIYDKALSAEEVWDFYKNPHAIYQRTRLFMAPVSVVAGGVETASVAPVSANWSVVSTTASYIFVATASVASVAAAWSVPSVSASYVQVEAASVAPVTASWTIPSVTATHQSTAVVVPVSASWSVVSTSATYAQVEVASPAPVVMTWSVVATTANAPVVSGQLAEEKIITVTDLLDEQLLIVSDLLEDRLIVVEDIDEDSMLVI